MAKHKNNPAEGASCPAMKTSIGGQALMEGIMMRGPHTSAMAVRNTKGEIVIERFPAQTKQRPAVCRWPVIRGVFGFIDSMTMGYKCLMRSAEISGLEEIEEEIAREKEEKKALAAAKKAVEKGTATEEQRMLVEKAKAAEAEMKAVKEAEKAVKNGTATEEQRALWEKAQKAEAEAKAFREAREAVSRGTATEEQRALIAANEAVKAAEPSERAEAVEETPVDSPAEKSESEKNGKAKKKEGSVYTDVVMIVSVVLAVAIMIGLFIWLPVFLYSLLAEHVPGFPDNRFVESVFESVVRILLMVGYMGLMCLMKDTRRTFQYHGAEHKTIFCYEHGLELTVENVRRERRFHPRCGTSFLMLMLLVGILIGFFIPAGLPRLLRVGIKILLMPLTMGLGYELIKICGRHDNWLTRIIAAPGLWFQRITVLEPDDAMIECAITAIKEVIPEDGSDRLK